MFSEKPTRREKSSKRNIVIAGVILVVLALAPSLGLGQGSQPWNDASRFLLSKTFPIIETPTTRYYNWELSQSTISPDGLARPMLLVNGMFPGPLIEANTGDRIVVNVTNNMDSGTAIHWHGIHQKGTPWMDGTMGVTQCAIPPGQSMIYNYTITNQWGTYWWHAHAASQYVDGIFGPLIVHSPDEPHLKKYDEDIIMMLQDYYHTPSDPLVNWYHSPKSGGSDPLPDNGLINGRNSFNCSKAAQAQFPTNTKCTDGEPLATFNFKAGSTYRIRLINTGAFADFQFSIDGHTLTVIEADGVDMQPVPVQRLPIHVAQRYSVLVHANETVGNYYVRATINTNCFFGSNRALDPFVKAVIHYENAPVAQSFDSTDWTAASMAPSCVDLALDMLHPYNVQPAPTADVSHLIKFTMKPSSDGILLGYANDRSWSPLMTNATLFQSQMGLTSFDATQQVVVLDKNVIELVLINDDIGPHPFHFHGYTFSVLGWGNGTYVPGQTPLEVRNPLRRDTITIPQRGWTVVRFVNDNPGLWTLHCHMDWHMEVGLLIQFESWPDRIRGLEIPSEITAMCGA
ncbi:hypothetical protein BGZ70_000358 [Mortierella alpina]|uniref:Multicopper oxidase n=1 Tax=Mortierella alpina TaxID=64518 RepID=A0A9P6IZW4_MORAP|nr:hypothetical protein BGZ70_000358 [Mortierella alpina]